jgi:hypothetical protein
MEEKQKEMAGAETKSEALPPTLTPEHIEVLAKHFKVTPEELGTFIMENLKGKGEMKEEVEEVEEEKMARSMFPSLNK